MVVIDVVKAFFLVPGFDPVDCTVKLLLDSHVRGGLSVPLARLSVCHRLTEHVTVQEVKHTSLDRIRANSFLSFLPHKNFDPDEVSLLVADKIFLDHTLDPSDNTRERDIVRYRFSISWSTSNHTKVMDVWTAISFSFETYPHIYRLGIKFASNNDSTAVVLDLVLNSIIRR